MSKRILIATILIAIPCLLKAQDKPTIQLSAYGELYYGYDINKPGDNNRPSYIVSHNRHNEVNLNLAYLKAKYETKKVRANIALMTGTYANANLANEPGVLKNIFEANAGVRLSRNHDLWLDAGIMPSHIGMETAIGKDNLTLTRSLMADNSPYFETGVKLNYTTRNEKWYVALLALNGWQNIQRTSGNNTPAFGGQITYKPTDKLTFNYSNIVCNVHPDSVRRWRWYHDFYIIYNPTEKIQITAAYDIGAEQYIPDTSLYLLAHTWAIIFKYSLTNKIALAGRYEQYYDYYGIIVNSPKSRGIDLTAYSINLDYSITKNAMLRVEGKYYTSPSYFTFESRNGIVRDNGVITAALCVAF